MTYRVIEIRGKRYLPNTFEPRKDGYCWGCAFHQNKRTHPSPECEHVNYRSGQAMCRGGDKVNYQPESPEAIANYTAALLTGRLEHGQK